MIALEALARIGDRTAWTDVCRLLTSSDPYLAAAALRALAAIDPDAARPLVEQHSHAANAILRAAAGEIRRGRSVRPVPPGTPRNLADAPGGRHRHPAAGQWKDSGC